MPKKDTVGKKMIYAQIDSLSAIAASYAIANEYDKLATSLGAKYTNAYTDDEETVYMNNIPSNQLKRWLILESERFSKFSLKIAYIKLYNFRSRNTFNISFLPEL